MLLHGAASHFVHLAEALQKSFGARSFLGGELFSASTMPIWHAFSSSLPASCVSGSTVPTRSISLPIVATGALILLPGSVSGSAMITASAAWLTSFRTALTPDQGPLGCAWDQLPEPWPQATGPDIMRKFALVGEPRQERAGPIGIDGRPVGLRQRPCPG
jgi:hypothetical protein